MGDQRTDVGPAVLFHRNREAARSAFHRGCKPAAEPLQHAATGSITSWTDLPDLATSASIRMLKLRSDAKYLSNSIEKVTRDLVAFGDLRSALNRPGSGALDTPAQHRWPTESH